MNSPRRRPRTAKARGIPPPPAVRRGLRHRFANPPSRSGDGFPRRRPQRRNPRQFSSSPTSDAAVSWIRTAQALAMACSTGAMLDWAAADSHAGPGRGKSGEIRRSICRADHPRHRRAPGEQNPGRRGSRLHRRNPSQSRRHGSRGGDERRQTRGEDRNRRLPRRRRERRPHPRLLSAARGRLLARSAHRQGADLGDHPLPSARTASAPRYTAAAPRTISSSPRASSTPSATPASCTLAGRD